MKPQVPINIVIVCMVAPWMGCHTPEVGAMREIAVGGWVRNPNVYEVTVSQSLTVRKIVEKAGGVWRDSGENHFIADVTQEGIEGQKKIQFAEWNVPLVNLGIKPSRCSQVLIGKRLKW